MGDTEAYAWGYMIGYMGEVPDEMRHAHNDCEDPDPEVWGSEGTPGFLTPDEARSFRQGYDDGCSMFSDHAFPEERGDD